MSNVEQFIEARLPRDANARVTFGELGEILRAFVEALKKDLDEAAKPPR